MLPDWITKVLASNPHGGPGHADDHGHLVVQLEYPIVYVDLIKRDVVRQVSEKVIVDAASFSTIFHVMCLSTLL